MFTEFILGAEYGIGSGQMMVELVSRYNFLMILCTSTLKATYYRLLIMELSHEPGESDHICLFHLRC